MQKTKLLFLFLLFLGTIQAQTLSYRVGNSGGGGSNVTAEINGYLSTDQQSVSLEIYSDIYNGINWTGTGNYDYYVNNTLIGSSTSSTTNIDISAYIPVSSVKIVSKAHTWSNVVAQVIITPTHPLADGPDATDITLCKNSSAQHSEEILTGNGVALKWFTSELGEGYSASPSTTTVGTTTYYVSQKDNAGAESKRSSITVTVIEDQLVLTCPEDKTLTNPASQEQIETEFLSFLNGFSNNSANTSSGTFSSNNDGFNGAYAVSNWSNAAQSPSSYANHSASTLNIGANEGGAGTTRQITIPANGVISFDWSATYTGSGGYTFEYIVNGNTTSISGGTGSGSKPDIAVNAGDIFQFRTWGFTQHSTYSVTVTNFKVKSALPSKNVTENGFVNSLATAKWSNAAQSASSYINHSASALNIGANAGGGGSARQITIPADGVISFDWSGTFTGSGGYVFAYYINNTETVITNGNGSGSKTNITVNEGDVFKISTWGYTQHSTYSTTITNFSFEYSQPNIGAVEGFFTNNGSIAVTYTAENSCGGTESCTKTFSTVKNTTANSQLSNKESVRYYPNPTKGEVSLDIEENATLYIYSIEGKVMKTQRLTEGTNSVDMYDFKAGIYSFRVITNNDVKTFKVIKE